MAQFIYTMNRVGKVVPPKRHILRDISLSFFPGAKIGVLGLNGAGTGFQPVRARGLASRLHFSFLRRVRSKDSKNCWKCR